MMTIIEQRTMDAVQSMNRKMRDQNEIDWEQRRYEIAKDALCAIIGTRTSMKENVSAIHIIKATMEITDMLINELKK